MKLLFICFLSYLAIVKSQYGYGNNFPSNSLFRFSIPRSNYPLNPMLNSENQDNSPSFDPQNPNLIDQIQSLFGTNSLPKNIRIITIGDPNLNTNEPNPNQPKAPKNKKNSKPTNSYPNNPTNFPGEAPMNNLIPNISPNLNPNMIPNLNPNINPNMIPNMIPNINMNQNIPSNNDYPTVVLPNGLSIKIIDPNNLINLTKLGIQNQPESTPNNPLSLDSTPLNENLENSAENVESSTDPEELKAENENTTANPLDQTRKANPKSQPKKSNKPVQQENLKSSLNPENSKNTVNTNPKKEDTPNPRKINPNQPNSKPKLICFPNPE